MNPPACCYRQKHRPSMKLLALMTTGHECPSGETGNCLKTVHMNPTIFV
jgi:hypothetical protein